LIAHSDGEGEVKHETFTDRAKCYVSDGRKAFESYTLSSIGGPGITDEQAKEAKDEATTAADIHEEVIISTISTVSTLPTRTEVSPVQNGTPPLGPNGHTTVMSM
jgi:hypothetical protein